MTDPRQALPPVNDVLADAEQHGIGATAPRQVLVDAVRSMLDDARARGGIPPDVGWLNELKRRVAEIQRPSLDRVINATGVVLHTNLGRAPLADAAVDAMTRVARYSTLEYDLEEGQRGSRQTHVRGLVQEITGAESAVVVNNAASAMVLVLNAIATGGETLVSRGELVEIGGGFRIPDILGRSGTVLIEVGTTNRTRLRDYEGSLSPRTRCALKVHRSNFSVSGFTAESTVEELAALMRPRGLPVIHDIGSGLLVDLTEFGLQGEPLVADSVAAGAIVVFSGDKLVGGPQAGIVAGPEEWIAEIAKNPFARAFRPDKMVLAGLETTLRLYRDRRLALDAIPTLKMLTTPGDILLQRADRLAKMIPDAATESGVSSVGGGSFPDAKLDTTLVAVPTERVQQLLDGMRRGTPPVIARAGDGRVLVDPRTLSDDEVPLVASVVGAALEAKAS